MLPAAAPSAQQTQETTPPPAFPPAEPGSLGYSAERLEAAAEALRSWAREGRIVGGEGRTLLHEVAGWRDCDRERWRPMERDTLFRLQSMAKPVLGTAALMLAEEGALSLADPVHRHVPEFDVDGLRGITVRQLLDHTAGLGYPEYNKRVWNGAFSSRNAAIRSLAERGAVHPPGEQFRYDNAHSDVLAEGGGRYASAYLIRGSDTVRYWDAAESEAAPFFRGAGGLYSTPLDYARFLSLWIQGGRAGGARLLDAETVCEARSGGELSRAAGGLPYGLHWAVFSSPGDPLVFGHDGSDGTIAIAAPDRRLIVVYFTQTRGTPTLVEMLELVAAAAPEGR